jgi:hypothetical protein
MGLLSMTGTMNMGVAPAWRLLFFLRPFLPVVVVAAAAAAAATTLAPAGAATGWKSLKMAFFWGVQGELELDEATEWFWAGVSDGLWDEVWVAYLADEVERNHISGLGNEIVGSEDELVVRTDRHNHRRSQDSRAVSESGKENAGVHHDGGV